MPSLTMLVLYNLDHFEEILAVWHDAGATEVTIIEGLGTRLAWEQGGRDDLPLLPTIRDLLESDDAPRRFIFAVVPDATAAMLEEATRSVLDRPQQHRSGVFLVVPVTRVVAMGGD